MLLNLLLDLANIDQLERIPLDLPLDPNIILIIDPSHLIVPTHHHILALPLSCLTLLLQSPKLNIFPDLGWLRFI